MHNSLYTFCGSIDTNALARITIVFVSLFLQEEARTTYGSLLQRTYVLHNGADGSLFYPKLHVHSETNKPPTIIYFGRLAPNKGVHILIQAMLLLQRLGVNAFCQIAGSSFFGGSPETAYTYGLRSNLPDNVQLLGYLSGRDLADVVRAADIACVPSVWDDPFPLVVLEAMACGLPVVASRSGGIPEALKNGGGILVSPGNVDILASNLRTLVLDSMKRRQMGAEALRSFQSHFQWLHVESHYREIVAEIATGIS